MLNTIPHREMGALANADTPNHADRLVDIMSIIQASKTLVPSFINKHEPAAKVHTLNWVRRHNLMEGDAVRLEKLKNDNYSAMTGRFYVTASRERLCLVNDILTLLFIVDDIADHLTDIEKAGATIDRILSRFLHTLDGNYDDGEDSIANAFQDIWLRIKLIASQRWQRQFICDIRLLFQAIHWEQETIKLGRIPSLKEYKRWRILGGGAHLAAHLIELAEDIQVKSIPDITDYLHQITRLTGILGCWANDIISIKKEQSHGSAVNLITVLMQEESLSSQEAFNKAVMIHNEVMEQFCTLLDLMPTCQSTHHQSMLKKYVTDLAAIVRGNIDWSLKDSQRYGFGEY